MFVLAYFNEQKKNWSQIIHKLKSCILINAVYTLLNRKFLHSVMNQGNHQQLVRFVQTNNGYEND